MDIKKLLILSKRSIAKEILILVGYVLILLIAWISILAYNIFAQKEIDKLIKSAQNQETIISNNLGKKENNQRWLIKKVFIYSSKLNYWDDIKLLTKRESNGDIEWNYAHILEIYGSYAFEYTKKRIKYEIGFTPSEFQNFVIRNDLDKYEKEKLSIMRQRINSLRSEASLIVKFDSIDQIEIIQKVGLILLIILYLVRPLILVVKWSVNTLKN